MKPLIALLILGSVATSAPAKGGTEMHEIANEHSFQQSTESPQTVRDAFSHHQYFGQGAAGFTRW